MSTVVIYLGGDGPTVAPTIDDRVTAVIAADSGLELADTHGMMVNIIIGDFDSVNPETVAKYVEAGAVVEEFPREKEVTDFELALLTAKDFEAENLVIIGGGGQRLDHFLANISVLCGEQTSRWIVDAYLGQEHIYVCRPNQARTIVGSIGDCISLIPIGSHAEGVTTSGLKWKLKNEQLDINFARGLSNEFVNETVRIEINSGALAILRSLETVEGKK